MGNETNRAAKAVALARRLADDAADDAASCVDAMRESHGARYDDRAMRHVAEAFIFASRAADDARNAAATFAVADMADAITTDTADECADFAKGAKVQAKAARSVLRETVAHVAKALEGAWDVATLAQWVAERGERVASRFEGPKLPADWACPRCGVAYGVATRAGLVVCANGHESH